MYSIPVMQIISYFNAETVSELFKARDVSGEDSSGMSFVERMLCLKLEV